MTPAEGLTTYLEAVEFGQIVPDMPLMCDYSEEPTCPKGAAKWAMFCARCTCGASGITLACGVCKDVRMSTEDGVECGVCGAVTIPARLAYSRIEAL